MPNKQRYEITVDGKVFPDFTTVSSHLGERIIDIVNAAPFNVLAVTSKRSRTYEYKGHTIRIAKVVEADS